VAVTERRIKEGYMMRGERTVAHIAVLDLLQDFWPDRCVALLVLVDAFGAQVEPLADAAGALVC
jgi:hypothetical protein